MTTLATHFDRLAHIEPRRIVGSVSAVRGLSLLVNDLPVPIGSLVRIGSGLKGGGSAKSIRGEVVGFDGSQTIVMLLDPVNGLAPRMPVTAEETVQAVGVGRSLLGRVIDGLGRPIDGRGPLLGTTVRPIRPPPTSSMLRRRIEQPLPTGIRAIDAMVTIGKGQRVGIFSGPGVGKSTLIATIARNTTADVNVIGLVGERGREVREFIDHVLGPQGLRRSVVVVATGDQSPLLRVRAAFVASAVAEHFRDQGADVMLMMDSITRFAQAQRQIGLTIGEQPATRGYTPSVFAVLSMMLERAGAMEGGGSITGLYAVLVEGDDMAEPVSDAARGILDGHVALARRLAARGHYPAIDVLHSVSRLADSVCDKHHIAARRLLRRLLSAYSEAEELINIGAYARGSNPACDAAIALMPRFETFLQQSVDERNDYPQTCKQLLELADVAKHELGRSVSPGTTRSTTQAVMESGSPQ